MSKHFLIFIIIFLSLTKVSFAEDKNLSSKLPHDGHVRFFASHIGELVDVTYLDAKGRWRADVERRLTQLFRSRQDGKTHVLDRRLIELADHLQDHFGVDTVEVICGYRSSDFNQQLKRTGHNVANESFHTQGLAMDIHLDEIDEASVRDYLLKLHLGGVGYYGRNLMVHMDFGPPRQWQDSVFFDNKGIGEFAPNTALHVTTDHLFYHLNGTLKLAFSGSAVGALHLQKFFRGQWRDVRSLAAEDWRFVGKDRAAKLSEGFLGHEQGSVFPSPFGKYRFRLEKGDFWQNSNEFYIKKSR